MCLFMVGSMEHVRCLFASFAWASRARLLVQVTVFVVVVVMVVALPSILPVVNSAVSV